MQHFLYNLGVKVYGLGIYIASFWIKKAQLWIQGRKNWKENLRLNTFKFQNSIWFHAASSGEFEQAKPIIEWIKIYYPHQKILVSFFSPSGYELCKNYKNADFITYLPLDTPQNTKDFLDIVQPQMAVFIKYEFWLNFLFEIHNRNVPCILISGIFRNNSPFFKGILKNLYQKSLKTYNQIFVQDYNSFENLKNKCNYTNVTIAGDTRFDRVVQIFENWKPIIEIENYLPQKPILMLGSSWLPDEIWFQKIYFHLPNWSLVIVPHEISEGHNQKLKELFPDAVFYSSIEKNPALQVQRVLIIDKMGWLSRLYYYADAVWIGGGFGVGIHNTLEAAVYGKPIFFGPNHKKFYEALGLIQNKAAFPVNKNTSIKEILSILEDKEKLKFAGEAAQEYVFSNQGATQKVIEWIKNYMVK